MRDEELERTGGMLGVVVRAVRLLRPAGVVDAVDRVGAFVRLCMRVSALVNDGAEMYHTYVLYCVCWFVWYH